MQFKIIADENIDHRIIQKLQDKKYYIISVFESFRGITDREVLKLAEKEQAIILTEDKDFGEWIYSHHIKSTGVILLRYQFSDSDKIITALCAILEKYSFKLYAKFTVISKNKIRIRNI